MKTILTGALIVMTALGVLSLWGSVHARRMSGPSSQIYIHGTPVCVTRQGGEIIASVGMCGPYAGESREDDSGNRGSFHGEAPSALEPRFGLPPGHPPVDATPFFERGRGILI